MTTPYPSEGSSSFGGSTSSSPATPGGFTSLDEYEVFAHQEPPHVYYAYDPSALDEQLAAGEQHSEFESGGNCTSPADPASRA